MWPKADGRLPAAERPKRTFSTRLLESVSDPFRTLAAVPDPVAETSFDQHPRRMQLSHKHLALVTSLIICTAETAHARWRDTSIYAEVAGRADVVGGFKKDAIARGWKVVCEQPNGPVLSIRVRIPAGTPEAALETYAGDIRDMRPYSVGFIYPGMPTSAPFCAPPENTEHFRRQLQARHSN